MSFSDNLIKRGSIDSLIKAAKVYDNLAEKSRSFSMHDKRVMLREKAFRVRREAQKQVRGE